MKLKEIYKILDEISPFETQASWDNSGLIVGDFEANITKIYLALEVDEALIEDMQEGSLILTHHPLIFSGLTTMDYATYPTKLLAKMIQKNISNIALHTNFDKSHLNAYVATEVLKKEIIAQEDHLIYLEYEHSFEAFALEMQKCFGLSHLKGVDSGKKEIKKVALCTGSGASMLAEVDADCFITGDIKYHDAMEAQALGLSMIDIGHFESERFFAEILAPYLKNLDLTVIISQSKNPFTYLDLQE